MKTWTVQTKLDSEGRLHLDVPIADGPQEVEVLLVVSARDVKCQRADWKVVEAGLGALAATVDPADWQRRLRREWAN